jgi:hypothetical protein
MKTKFKSLLIFKFQQRFTFDADCDKYLREIYYSKSSDLNARI